MFLAQPPSHVQYMSDKRRSIEEAAIAAASPPERRKLGPYSRVFRRGAIGNSIDGRSATGRLIRDMERQLIEHVGGKPSVPQKLLIERMIKVRLQLDLLDEKLASGDWTPHDGRTYGGLLNAYRLIARELGMKAAAARQPTIQEIMAERARKAVPVARNGR